MGSYNIMGPRHCTSWAQWRQGRGSLTCIKFMFKKKAGKNLCTFISTQSTSEKTQERLAMVFSSRKENWVAGDRNGRELLLYTLLCLWNFVPCE